MTKAEKSRENLLVWSWRKNYSKYDCDVRQAKKSLHVCPFPTETDTIKVKRISMDVVVGRYIFAKTTTADMPSSSNLS